MHSCNLCNHELIVTLATVFKEHGKWFPDVDHELVRKFGAFKQFKEANRVNKEASVNTINCFVWKSAFIRKLIAVYAITDNSFLVFRLGDDARDGQVFSFLEGLIDPSFKHFAGNNRSFTLEFLFWFLIFWEVELAFSSMGRSKGCIRHERNVWIEFSGWSMHHGIRLVAFHLHRVSKWAGVPKQCHPSIFSVFQVSLAQLCVTSDKLLKFLLVSFDELFCNCSVW